MPRCIPSVTKLLPPRALFTDRGRRLLTTGGRRDGEAQAYQAGTPLLWNVNNPSQPPKELDSIVAGAITTNVAMRLPGDPDSIVLVSAGAGLFQVSPKLAQITKQRMMDNGIGMDMLSLAVRSRRPVSVAPSHHASSPGVMDVGGFFFDFEAPRRCGQVVGGHLPHFHY